MRRGVRFAGGRSRQGDRAYPAGSDEISRLGQPDKTTTIPGSVFHGAAERDHRPRRSMFLRCFPLDDFQVEHEYSVEHGHQQQFYESRDS